MTDAEGQIIRPLTKDYNVLLEEALYNLGLNSEISYYGDRIAVRIDEYNYWLRIHGDPSRILDEAIKSINPDATAIFAWAGAIFYHIEVRL